MFDPELMPDQITLKYGKVGQGYACTFLNVYYAIYLYLIYLRLQSLDDWSHSVLLESRKQTSDYGKR